MPGQHGSEYSSRRTFLKAAGGVGATGLIAGCTGDGGEAVRFVLNPAESDVAIEEQYAPMMEYLEEETSAEIESVLTSSYTETLQAIRNDQAEIADTSPSAAVAGSDVADVIGIRVAFGAAQYFSLITTTPDSPVDELADIEGRQIALGDVLSVSGTLVPLTMIQNAGLDVGDAPRGDAVDFEVAGYSDHTTARQQLVERGEIVAAGTGAFSTAPHVPQAQFDELSQEFADISAEYGSAGEAADEQELQLLSVSDPLPRAPLMSRSNWDADVREDIEQAILDATEDDLSHDEDYEGEELWFTGVEPGDESDFEPIQRVLDELGLEFEELT